MINDELIEHIMRINGISSKSMVTGDDLEGIVRSADTKNLWPDTERVMLWHVGTDDDSDVFIVTVDLSSGVRLATTSFDMKDVFGGGSWTEHPFTGAPGVLRALEYIDVLVRGRLEDLAKHARNTA